MRRGELPPFAPAPTPGTAQLPVDSKAFVRSYFYSPTPLTLGQLAAFVNTARAAGYPEDAETDTLHITIQVDLRGLSPAQVAALTGETTR